MPEPEPVAEPEPEAEAPPAEAQPEAAPETQPEPGDAPGEAVAEDEILSDEELEEVFGSEDDAPPPLESIVETDVDEEPDEPIDPDDLSEEPIPQVFTATHPAGEEERGLGLGIIIPTVAVVVLIVLAAGLYFARFPIAAVWPGAKPIYAMLGISAETLGEGLDIRNVKSERQIEDGGDVLVVRGVIFNVSDEPRPVPLIRLALFDASGEEVLVEVIEPRKGELEADTGMGFKARLKDTPATARRLEVTFTAPEMPDEGGQSEAAGQTEGSEKPKEPEKPEAAKEN